MSPFGRSLIYLLGFFISLANGLANVEIKEDEWSTVELHDTGIDEINWHDHLQFYWNTPILTASSDREIHPFLQENIFSNLNEILKVLPSADNRFGDVFNISDVLTLLDALQNELEEPNRAYSSFSELISIYKKRIVSWMALYTRGQCVIDCDLNSLYLLVLSPGDMVPLHAAFNFPVNNIEHESHDLISILSIQPEEFYANNEGEDGIFIYDPRGTASGYGFANVFIKTAQSEQLNSRGGYLHIFPSGIKFNTLPVDYTRVFLISFARLYSIHQPYRQQNKDREQQPQDGVLPVYHLQNERTSYLHKNDEPFFDQNIQFFSSFGTPIFESKIANYKSLSIPAIDIDLNTFEVLSKCFVEYASTVKSVRKSNRNGWQSTADIFDIYKSIKWNVAQDTAECVDKIGVLYNYLIEQVALWLLSFSNSYYFDDNGLIINFQTMNDNKIYIDILDSWININTGIAMNVPHSHPNSDLSGIIYIDIPAKTHKNVDNFDGDAFFEDPRTNLFDNNMHLQFAQFNEPLQITPQVGNAVLFPSWLRHWTMPSYDPQPRISLAFNVRFKGIHLKQSEKGKEKEKTRADIQILKREL